MGKNGRPEVSLEVGAGFFRISTETVIYNITVIDRPTAMGGLGGGQLAGAGPVPRVALTAPDTDLPDFSPELFSEQEGDDYYKKVSNDIFNDIGNLAKSLSSTMGNIPLEDRRMQRVELDEAGEKIEDAKNQLHDIVSMTERATMEIMDQVDKVQSQTDGVKELLLSLKNHTAFQASSLADSEQDEPSSSDLLKSLREKVNLAAGLFSGLQEDSGAEPVDDPSNSAPPVDTDGQVPVRSRYVFSIDVIFQTMYELCTNETVKTHISGARQRAAEIFSQDVFLDSMAEKVKNLVPDSDNFFTVPLSDVLFALLAACTDVKIKNLLKKMDISQADIFLDQSLPLETPPIEEVKGPLPKEAGPEQTFVPSSGSGSRGQSDARCADLSKLLAEIISLSGNLEVSLARGNRQANGMSQMSMDDQAEIFTRIESAFNVASSITDDISRITEALSFQDLSGQQILKIIKLLTDFQIQLLAIVVSFGSQLKVKERNSAITVEESKKIAQEDVDRYLKSMTTEEVGGEGALDQAAVNDLLQSLGF